MRLSVFSLLVAVVVMSFMVDDTNAWIGRVGRSISRWGRRAANDVGNWGRRVRLLKRKIGGQNGNVIPDGCDFGCFWIIHDTPSQTELDQALAVFQNVDTNDDDIISQEEFDAFANRNDAGNSDNKRELMDELEGLKSMLEKEDEKK